MTLYIIRLFSAEAQKAQKALFFLPSADPRGISFAFHRAGTSESKNPQAPAGYDDLIRIHKRSLDYVFFAALLLSSSARLEKH